MRALRKMNRGLIVFLIILAVLTAYLIVLNMSQNAQKAQIKEFCKEAADIFSQCMVIPPELYTDSDTYSEEAFEQYQEDCYQKLAPLCSDTNTVKSILKYALELQTDSGNYITTIDNAYIKYINYSFNGDTVSVNIDSNVNYKMIYREDIYYISGKTLIASPSLSFELQKEDGEWKLLAYNPSLFSYFNAGFNNYYYGYYGGY